MNKHTLTLLQDLDDAGVLDAPAFIKPAPDNRNYLRTGYVAKTDETEKMEIDGLLCGVTHETEKGVRVFVFVNGRGATGPYSLKPSEVVS